MGQELQLKLDVPVKSSAMGKSPVANNSSKQDTVESKPFSSALEEQLEKQPVESKKSSKSTASDQVEKAEASKKDEVSAEEIVTKDGNVLPEESSADAVVQFLVTGGAAEVSGEAAEISDEVPEVSDEIEGEVTPVESIGGELAKEVTLLDDALVKPQAQLIKPVATQEGKEEIKPKVKPVAGAKNTVLKTQQAIETIKTSTVADDSNTELKTLNPEQKKQAPILRSDILNALTKKTGGEGEKIKVDETVMKTEKTMTAQMLDKPFNDVRKMAELLTQQKQESPLLKSVPEKNVGGFVAALTPGSISSAATTAVQVTSTGQPVLALQPSMQSEAWGKVLSSRVVWMAREGVQQAELRLNPAKLGPVDVKLHMSNDQANVTFVAQNAATRDALEQALPRLRESFQENGMNLANANVSDQQAEQNNEEEKSEHSSSATKMAGDELDLDAENDLIESNELELGVSVFA